MADHTKFVALAKRLIDKQGRTIALQTLSSAAANPAQPWKGPTAPTVSVSVDTKAVFLPASGNDFSSMSVTKEMLADVTQVALVAPHELPLHEMTTMVDKGKTYKVQWCRVLEPADQVCLYAFGVKQ
jgi:hypothetical protein